MLFLHGRAIALTISLLGTVAHYAKAGGIVIFVDAEGTPLLMLAARS